MEQDSCAATFFTPSLWKQRRSFILDILKEHKVQKVLDYGCGEGNVLSFLIPPSATDDIHFTHLMGIDIDRQLLEQETLAACQPWASDYEHLRETPLTVDIYCGSVDQVDDRFMMTGCRDAIVCSEVIEHVYPDTLNACLPIMLGIYAPSLVIVTTPNAEYNVFFPDLQYGAPGATYRHDDHKFEWTRQEFEEWCVAGAKEYGYDVSFHGIGLLDGKLDRLEHGYCTQACIFTKQQECQQQHSPSKQQQLDMIHQKSTPHTLLKSFEFPYYDLPPLPDNEIFQHVEYYVSDLCQAATLHHNQAKESYCTTRQKHDTVNDELDSPAWSTENYNFGDPDASIGTTVGWGAEYIDNNDNSYQNDGGISLSSSEEEEDDDDDQSSDKDNHYEPLWTMTPLTIDLDTLWSILHIRQLCTTKERLVQVLGLDQSYYKVIGDQLVVHKSFEFQDRTS
ncbi:hypothetical protein BC941DRAFT_469470 [Chlamydoabsidia padenii]|nr:hypothetical protein BC941DRAFT_469470 [Chlamydoabsidia padenii]